MTHWRAALIGLGISTVAAGSLPAQVFWHSAGPDKIRADFKVQIGEAGKSALLFANGSSANFSFKNFTTGASLFHYGDAFRFRQGTGGGPTVVFIDSLGDVNIGSGTPRSKLSVEGTVTAQEIVVTQSGWPDFVFAQGYELLPLPELDKAIRDAGHLPGIPSAAEVAAQGVSLGEMQARMLQKIEELTLYVIELDREKRELEARLENVTRSGEAGS